MNLTQNRAHQAHYASWVLIVRQGKEPIVKRCDSEETKRRMMSDSRSQFPMSQIISLQTNPGDPKELWAESLVNYMATVNAAQRPGSGTPGQRLETTMCGTCHNSKEDCNCEKRASGSHQRVVGRIVAIGKPLHFAAPSPIRWAACGVQGDTTGDPKSVTCLRCRKTRRFKASPNDKLTHGATP